MTGGKRLLKHIGDIVAAAVLQVIHAPASHGLAAHTLDHGEHPLGVLNVGMLAGDYQNRADGLHRDDPNHAGQRPAALGPERRLQSRRSVLRVARRDGKQHIRLARQTIDIERSDQPDQGVACRRIADHDKTVTARIGGDAAAVQ